jgi:hypothetical protein
MWSSRGRDSGPRWAANSHFMLTDRTGGGYGPRGQVCGKSNPATGGGAKTERGGRDGNYFKRANSSIRVKIATGIASSMV